ncbi:ubiquitin specific protease-like protein [Naegleria gruberi]|uniref:Ubiquitin carboxyl-terminal hydrolase n=1 Tax=Naegleria gruberi TaxID=5762 RepID=D2VSJ6_NAEGR|nr:ubiquitin specific protease-like protein [Naegleria gruberi]EFC40132.1 ubiquitin specific protease-like protein [Naegleria gruberi]|eukprot:XP_002672876.1 ubiquitin specific protease-like protein [Naegleria gruberi strain NEG-M]
MNGKNSSSSSSNGSSLSSKTHCKHFQKLLVEQPANPTSAYDEYGELSMDNSLATYLNSSRTSSTLSQLSRCNCCTNHFSLKDENVMCTACFHIFTLHTFSEGKQERESTSCPQCKNDITFHLTYKEFFCLECFDFVTLEHDSLKYVLLPSLFSSSIMNNSSDKQSEKKRKISHNTSRETTEKTNKDFNLESSIKTMLKSSVNTRENSLLGLRGMVNLGNTCFMNCILQTLSHIIPLRNYFLSGTTVLKIESEIENNPEYSSEYDLKTYLSISKAVRNMYTEMYNPSNSTTAIKSKKRSSNGKRKSDGDEVIEETVFPFVPDQFLYLIWNAAGNLAGYQQQDAHEFYITLLSFLMPVKLPNNQSNTIQELFTGQVQSDIICKHCGHVSSTMEPILDVSLALKGKSGKEWIDLESLEECLEKYTNDESLEINDYSCSSCKTKATITKQLKFSKLPKLVCFHLKRFEHNEGVGRKSASSSKIDEHISFPFTLNMTPYMSRSSQTKDNNSPTTEEYSLFSVVCHTGDMSGGHYTCFVKHDVQWYLCNDSSVYYAMEEDVADSEAYCLFYMKK